jgi:hypothetical protein
MTKAEMGLRDTQQGGALFALLAEHWRFGFDDTECTRRRDAECVHGFAAQKLADAGAQHRAPVTLTRKRCRPGAFQVQIPQLAVVQLPLAEQQAATIAEIGIVVAELVAGVFHRQRLPA